MSTYDLACQEVVEIVTDYLEGALTPEDRNRFEAHLATCPGCDTYLQQMRQTIDYTGTLRVEDVPPAAMSELLRAFRTWRG